MSGARTEEAAGPDFSRGVAIAQAPLDGFLAGHVGGEPVLLARRTDGFWAVSATCTHYGGPLSEGLAVGDTVRCPWHHACFDLRSGEALAAPAMSPLDTCASKSKATWCSCAREKRRRCCRRRPRSRRIHGAS
ncbi:MULTISPECIES: Rieske 2Fe-2S domain-containing protein [unclassified Brevundimonas]